MIKEIMIFCMRVFVRICIYILELGQKFIIIVGCGGVQEGG